MAREIYCQKRQKKKLNEFSKCSQRTRQIPETGINFQKEEGEIFKEIKINSRTSHQEITMFPGHRKLQRQKWHPAQSLKRNWWRESQEPSTEAFVTRKGKAGAAL